LRTSGIDVAVEDVSVYGRTPTRLHIALAMVEQGHTRDTREAFDKYLGAGCPAYVPASKIETRSAIDMIHDVGGVGSLAHPGDWTPEEHIRKFVGWGLDALEVIHPSHDERLAGYFERIADQLGLMKTGGSDFHGPDASGKVALGQHGISLSWYGELKAHATRGSQP
ncbi:MAG: phosphatase, partial [Rhodothermia bacterium]|nr:phosphatase [Rhodothermia bacterium]